MNNLFELNLFGEVFHFLYELLEFYLVDIKLVKLEQDNFRLLYFMSSYDYGNLICFSSS